MEHNVIAQRIRAFRKLKGYTQSELSDRLGVSIAVLGAIERGNRKPEQRLLALISSTLGIDPEELTAANIYSRDEEGEEGIVKDRFNRNEKSGCIGSDGGSLQSGFSPYS